jgi:hypothetical protein
MTGQTLSSRTLVGRFLFAEVELLQVLMERLGPGCALIAVLALAEHTCNLLDIRRHGDHEALRQSWLTVVVKLYPLDPSST